MEQVWWEQISKARSFIDSIISTLSEGKSIILRMPRAVPWRNHMEDLIFRILTKNAPEKTLVFSECPDDKAGNWLFENYCMKSLRQAYRVGITQAAFLAREGDAAIHSYYLWIRNIPTAKIKEWTAFVSDYNINRPSGTPKAGFILEINDPGMGRLSGKGIVELNYDSSIDAYDRYAFCTLASSGVSSTRQKYKPYLADIVAAICSEDIELCEHCIKEGERFLNNPISVLKDISDSEIRSNSEKFECGLSEKELQKRIWNVQLKQVFPVIEMYRAEFIKKHFNEIKKQLPFITKSGKIIQIPEEAEIGVLYHFMNKKMVVVSSDEEKAIDLLWGARNDLAHIKPIEFGMVKKILDVVF